MQKKYNASHKTIVFEESDFASLAIPKEDRAPTDNPRMIVKIVEIPRENRHRVPSIYGVIDGLITTRSLNVIDKELFPELMAQFDDAPTTRILLSQAAKKASNTKYIALSFNCKAKCMKSCRWVKNGKKYTQYCHKSEFDYTNLPNTILELTEAQVVPRIDKAPKRKRAITASTEKLAAKKPASSRNHLLQLVTFQLGIDPINGHEGNAAV